MTAAAICRNIPVVFARQTFAAGVVVTVAAGVVLAGWAFDVSLAKSLLPGWRVMVPSSALSFVLIGLVLVLEGRASRRHPSAAGARSLLPIAAMVLPLLTVGEYLTGARLGLESWLGIPFPLESRTAGRMSPQTSLCFTVLAFALIALSTRRPAAVRAAQIASSAILMLSWLAMLAVSFDTDRLLAAPRFPGMAAHTILLMAIASAATLELAMLRMPELRTRDAVLPSRLIAAAFSAPLLLGLVQLRAEQVAWINPDVVTAVIAMTFAGAVAGVVWAYAGRLEALKRERASVLAELERRVEERTHELAESNRELLKREDLLQDADRRKDEFLATLAHELRNPLAPIRNAVGLLRDSHAAPAIKAEGVRIIERQVSLMVRLIDDLLDVSRITAGKLPLRRSPVDLGEILEQAMVTTRPHVEQGGHRLTLTPALRPIYVDGDVARLSQVFANLLHNACKYTEPGGLITVTVTTPSDTTAEVSIRDNGIGIPEVFLPRLFEKFSQVAPALDRSQGGLGLGLSLVHGIVTLHDGQVTARSGGAGCGSEFVVRLPTVAAPETAPAPADGPAPPVASRRILVVDDNEDSAESLALLLRMRGHLVQTAHDGEQALAAADQFQPDVILLDLGMPKMNGFEVCRSIRQAAWSTDTLIVAQTGWGQDQDRERTRAAGFDAHLTKPVDPAMLQALLAAKAPGRR